MKFTGKIRVPEIDHPGVPATFLIDDVQAEVVLEGESLGRWSLYDVHATRLVSSAFQVELADEEITFLADDPIDFAYRGVEHMAEVWARFKSMNVARRPIAVRRSRRGTTTSKISELRDAMVENLQSERSGFLTEREPVDQDDITAESVAQEIESLSDNAGTMEPVEPATETRIPVLGETTGDEGDRLDAQRVEAERTEQQRVESERLEADKRAIEEERARLDAEKKGLEAERLKAEQMEADRVEAFRLEMERLENERDEQKRLEAERSEAARIEMERLQAERAEMERLDAERDEQKRLDAERAESVRRELASIEKKRKEIEQLESERAEQERLDAERLDAIQVEMQRLESQRAEDQRLEAERAEIERLEAEKLEQERVAAKKAAAEQAEEERVTQERLEAESLATEQAEEERVTQERLEAAKAQNEDAVEETPPELAKEILSTSGDSDDSEASKQLVVDLGEFEEPAAEPGPDSDSETDSQPEPALAGAPREKSGIMGAVKSAFSRSGRNHVHDLVEAPGGIGIGRSICEECGYVSISSSD
ncbi:MAG: hypothetical protein V3U46_01165 [Acidimicrobiia bacterium]